MKVKIDTKEKFHVISVLEPILSANMTEELQKMLLSFLNNETKNVILKVGMVETIDESAGKIFAELQQSFNNNKASFVICELKKNVEESLEKQEILELLNVTPTESEACDIVQMEEIEREFLD